jgi:hypothetical protein
VVSFQLPSTIVAGGQDQPDALGRGGAGAGDQDDPLGAAGRFAPSGRGVACTPRPRRRQRSGYLVDRCHLRLAPVTRGGPASHCCQVGHGRTCTLPGPVS